MGHYTFTQSELDAIAAQVAEYTQIEEPDIRTDYVGRSYGNQCVGVVIPDEGSIALVTALLARRIAEQDCGEGREPSQQEILETIADLGASQKLDGMGRDMIIYWWCVTLREA